MTGLIVKHWVFWRREIPAENIWSDRLTYGEDKYERVPGRLGGFERLRFIPEKSIVSRVPK